MEHYEFTVVIERDEDGRYVAICPTMPGCYTEGDTEEEAWKMIDDAIRLHIEHQLENGGLIDQEEFTEGQKRS